MYKQQLVCDNCDKTLRGTNGTAEMKEDHISIRGESIKHEWDDETDEEIYFYLTPQKGATITFCDTDCLNDYIEIMKIRAEKAGWHFGRVKTNNHGE